MTLILLLLAAAAIPAVDRIVRALITIISQLVVVTIVVALALAVLMAMSGHLQLR